ncbi:MAG: fructosamine kinase family protein [Bacteroidota bacterium]
MLENFFQSILDTHCHGEKLKNYNNVGGGCINNAFRLNTNHDSYFVKWNSKDRNDLFKAEKQGLAVLKDASQIKVPDILGSGVVKDKSYLLLKWINQGHQTSQFWKIFGRDLALMHQETADQFGLDHDNFIGSLHQSNHQHGSWASFYTQERLLPQLELAVQKRLIDSKTAKGVESLCKRLPDLIPAETPALLHGDLWNGNFLANSNACPVLIDPAVHYGHRETELAFTHLFGGFDRTFYQSYEQTYPLEKGFESRIDIHNIYPLLVHVNLFGSSYLNGIQRTIQRFS